MACPSLIGPPVFQWPARGKGRRGGRGCGSIKGGRSLTVLGVRGESFPVAASIGPPVVIGPPGGRGRGGRGCIKGSRSLTVPFLSPPPSPADNNIGDAGAKALLEAVRANGSLKELWISSEFFFCRPLPLNYAPFKQVSGRVCRPHQEAPLTRPNVRRCSHPFPMFRPTCFSLQLPLSCTPPQTTTFRRPSNQSSRPAGRPPAAPRARSTSE